jgi:hypothetical protein
MPWTYWPDTGRGNMVDCWEQGTETLSTIRSTSRRTLLFGQTYTKVVTLVLFK